MPKAIEDEIKPIAPPVKYIYLCPACSGYAIKTSNKMTNVQVDCEQCGKLISLNDDKRYIKA